MILNGFQKNHFQNRYMALETPSRPPPFMANTILNFHFDYPQPSLMPKLYTTLRLFDCASEHTYNWIFPLHTITINLKIQFALEQISFDWSFKCSRAIQFVIQLTPGPESSILSINPDEYPREVFIIQANILGDRSVFILKHKCGRYEAVCLFVEMRGASWQGR